MEASAGDIITKQFELFKKIARAVENLKKGGQGNITVGTISARLELIKVAYDKFEANHESLITKFKEVIKTSEYNKSDLPERTEETYIQQKGFLKDMLNDLEGNSKSTTVAESNETSFNRKSLPVLKLEQFSGHYEDWPAFKDLFWSLIGRHAQLTDVEKLQYLKTVVKGTATNLIKELPTTHDNFSRAWKILSDHYENKRILVRTCLNKFFELSRMSTESATELEKLKNGAIVTLNSLEGIGRPIPSSEDFFVHSVVNLFEDNTRGKWEDEVASMTEPPSIKFLNQFIANRLVALQGTPSSVLNKSRAAPSDRRPMNPRDSSKNSTQSRESSKNSVRSFLVKKNGMPNHCALCKGEHYLMCCDKYQSQPQTERKRIVETTGSCFNCLGPHKLSSCPSKKGCYACGGRHHSSLHDAYVRQDTPISEGGKKVNLTFDCSLPRSDSIQLATALVRIKDDHGDLHTVRALIDQGSEVSIVTERLMQRLRLKRSGPSTAVYGVGGMKMNESRGATVVDVWSCDNKENLMLRALILPRITSNDEYREFKPEWPHLQGLQLADPDPSQSYKVDILLGADVYPAIMRGGFRKGIDANQPIAQETIFGWIVTGPTSKMRDSRGTSIYRITVGDPLSDLVRRFWEQEELSTSLPSLTADEQSCEEHFLATHARNHEGRYIVRLPFRHPLPDFFSSRKAAVNSLIRMEKRFLADLNLRDLYKEFMDTYEDLGHMSRTSNIPEGNNSFFLPHHGVFRASSSTTKLRVVFNGSWHSSSTASINSHLHAGPNLLPNLADILLRWRRHQFVLSTDIVKMYRQILVHPEDRDFQRIVWRRNEGEKIREYRLNTITYGLISAPFLAIRTLHQLARDEGERYPLGATALLRHTYMDDILTGADTIEDLQNVKCQLVDLCRAGGFPLQKWASNCQLLSDETENKQFKIEIEQGLNSDQFHASLGLRWNQRSDCFTFSVPPSSVEKPVTKRTIVSETAKLFDPLGWLAPTVIKAKMMIQTAWLLGLDWDESLPEGEAEPWRKFQSQLTDLQSVEVPRKLTPAADHDLEELHGFSDASERAFAAVIYLRSRKKGSHPTMTLVAAKTRVAPLKTVSLPRLELCGAVLLARLLYHVQTALDLAEVPAHLWTDSMVTLGWIKGHPSRWKTYVSNRVSEIQQITSNAQWHHISGYDNPADAASRGMWPREFVGSSLWWNGPEFLLRSDEFPKDRITEYSEELPEEKKKILTVTVGQAEGENAVVCRFSSYRRLIRVATWCRRWAIKIRKGNDATSNLDSSRETILSAEELNETEEILFRMVQEEAYRDEREQLKENRSLANKSKLLKLTPFLDQRQLLRVGGRIKHSLLSYDEKHPIILPPSSHLTSLIIEHFHRLTFHGGVQATLGAIRQRFWLPAGRNLVKGTIRRCVTCVRWRAATSTQLMADLPKPRVTPTRAFLHVGLDYAGPILLRTSPGRGHKSCKAFIVVFVCMCTRAIHLDVASSYSSEAFLATFRRFISRRGLCSDIYSDCGTNFQGADAELRRLFAAKSRENQSIRSQLGDLRIKWHFNTPAAPHHGGLWEAAVKSTKHHLRRVVGEKSLTYEEMATFLSQVEACLNSRPIAASSDDPSDLSSLTPGHLLIGGPITALPEPSLLDVTENRLSRWQLVVQMRDHFWMRWRDEYLRSLIPRQKWLRIEDSIEIGSLCLVMSEITPPTRWPLARITDLHPGSDGHVRVCTVKTANSKFIRPISKLIFLPVAKNSDE